MIAAHQMGSNQVRSTEQITPLIVSQFNKTNNKADIWLHPFSFWKAKN
jgi:hypothetical protein